MAVLESPFDVQRSKHYCNRLNPVQKGYTSILPSSKLIRMQPRLPIKYFGRILDDLCNYWDLSQMFGKCLGFYKS